jgi:hypothetical protein
MSIRSLRRAPRKTTIDYLYDFGDCWEHRLVTNIRAGDLLPSLHRR